MDLAPTTPVYRCPGPFLSVYLDATRETDEATEQLEITWRRLRQKLALQGISSTVLDTLAERVLAPTGETGHHMRMIVSAADSGEVVFDEVVANATSQQTVSWGPLPDLTPWVVDRDAIFPVLVVFADTVGVDLELYREWARPPGFEERCDGQTLQLTKTDGPRVVHKTYRRRTEGLWRFDIDQAASEIDHHTEAGVQLVLLTGDARACMKIHQNVSESTNKRLIRLEQEHRQSGPHAVAQAIRDVIDNAVFAEQLNLLQEYDYGHRHGPENVGGLRNVLEATLSHRVATILMDPTRAAGVEIDPRTYPRLTLPEAAMAASALPTDLVVLAAAAASNTDLAIVGSHGLPSDGTGALLHRTQGASIAGPQHEGASSSAANGLTSRLRQLARRITQA